MPQEGIVRNVFGPQGLIQSPAGASRRSSKHMAPQRVAELVVRAAVHKVDKCWIAKHPVLLMGMNCRRFSLLKFKCMHWVAAWRVIVSRRCISKCARKLVLQMCRLLGPSTKLGIEFVCKSQHSPRLYM